MQSAIWIDALMGSLLFNRPLAALARQAPTNADLLPPRPDFVPLARNFAPAGLRRQKQQSLREAVLAA
jgi:hypothetical protein